MSVPKYHMNIMKISGHEGYLWPFSKFDLERSISDLEGKNSKFRLLEGLRISTKNISVRFRRFPVETVGGDRF